MINYIEGPRCSGKTTKLLEQVKAYLTLYPEGKAIVISPTWCMSDFVHDMWDGDEDRVVFTSYDRYQKTNCRIKTNYYAIFIDEVDLILNQLFDCNVLSVTRQV